MSSLGKAHRRRSVGLHEARQLGSALDAFREWEEGDAGMVRRALQIGALPTVEWKGRTLYSIRCAGPYGKGPHIVNVPESLLWALIDVRQFRCPFHQ